MCVCVGGGGGSACARFRMCSTDVSTSTSQQLCFLGALPTAGAFFWAAQISTQIDTTSIISKPSRTRNVQLRKRHAVFGSTICPRQSERCRQGLCDAMLRHHTSSFSGVGTSQN